MHNIPLRSTRIIEPKSGSYVTTTKNAWRRNGAAVESIAARGSHHQPPVCWARARACACVLWPWIVCKSCEPAHVAPTATARDRASEPCVYAPGEGGKGVCVCVCAKCERISLVQNGTAAAVDVVFYVVCHIIDIGSDWWMVMAIGEMMCKFAIAPAKAEANSRRRSTHTDIDRTDTNNTQDRGIIMSAFFDLFCWLIHNKPKTVEALEQKKIGLSFLCRYLNYRIADL